MVGIGAWILPSKVDLLSMSGSALHLGHSIQFEKCTVHAVGIGLGNVTSTQLVLLLPQLQLCQKGGRRALIELLFALSFFFFFLLVVVLAARSLIGIRCELIRRMRL